MARDRAAAAAHRETRPVVSESRPLATPAPEPAEAAPTQAAQPAAPAAVEADGPVVPAVAFPPPGPDPILLDTGEKPVQGRDENWQDFNERHVRYLARLTANERSIAENNAAIQKQNAEIERIRHNAQLEILASWQERQAKAAEKYPDCVAVTSSVYLPFTETMASHVISMYV